MSLKHGIADLIHVRGATTLKELELAFPAFSRKQIQNALDNARASGRVKTVTRGWSGPGGGFQQSVYGPANNEARERKKPVHRKPSKPKKRFPSVFHMAGEQLAGPWPPTAGQSTVYAQLGGWD